MLRADGYVFLKTKHYEYVFIVFIKRGKIVKKIAVIGAGVMGSQIAFASASAGYQTNLMDLSEYALSKAKQNLKGYTNKLVEKNQFTNEDVEEAFKNLHFFNELSLGVQDADLVIEAIVEKLEVKQELFKQLSMHTKNTTILASNSSTIVSSKLIEEVSNPSRVCNIHFFNPAIKMNLVEIVKGEHTSEETVRSAKEFALSLKKEAVVLEKEIYGFIVNRLLNVFFDEAIYLYETGYASFEDIDIAIKNGLNHPMGPFELLDYTGIDVNYFVRQVEYEETKDESKKPQKVLAELFERGDLGRKAKKGFYQY